MRECRDAVYGCVCLWACVCTSPLAGALLHRFPQGAGAGAGGAGCTALVSRRGFPSIKPGSPGLFTMASTLPEPLSRPEQGFCTMWGYCSVRLGPGCGGQAGCGEVRLVCADLRIPVSTGLVWTGVQGRRKSSGPPQPGPLTFCTRQASYKNRKASPTAK